MKRLWGSALAVAMISGPANADGDYEFIRTACVPKGGYFEVEYHSINSTLVSHIYDGPGSKRQRTAWAAAGYRNPQDLALDCKLPGHSFRVTAEQDESSSGNCQAYPPIWLRITRDGVQWLGPVVAGGQDCYQSKISSFDSIQIGPEDARLCATAVGGGAQRCEFIYAELFPLSQADIEAFATAIDPGAKEPMSVGVDAIVAKRRLSSASAPGR